MDDIWAYHGLSWFCETIVASLLFFGVGQVNKIPAEDRAPPLRKGGFPLSDNFSVRKHVYLARVSKIETLYGRSSIYLKVEPRSTFTFTRGL